MWSVSLTTAKNLTRLCAHTESTCTRIAAGKTWTWPLLTQWCSAHHGSLQPESAQEQKNKKFSSFPEISRISSAAIGTSLVIQTSVHFNLPLAEEPAAYLSWKTFLRINVMTSESFFAYFRCRTEAGTSLRKDLLFGWELVCCSLLSCLLMKVWPSQLIFSFLQRSFVIYNFIHKQKEAKMAFKTRGKFN